MNPITDELPEETKRWLAEQFERLERRFHAIYGGDGRGKMRCSVEPARWV